MKYFYTIKNKLTFISVLLLSCFSILHAETISGVIVDEKTNKPVDNVVIVTYASQGEKMSLSNTLGAFSIEVPDSMHHVKVVFSHLGYKAKECVLDITKKNKIKLTPQSVQLKDVVVKSNWIYHKDGKEIVNVASIPNAKDLQTDQVLTRIPGILKSSGGGYSLNGKSATIFINGVKQNITAASLESFLSSLPANAVSSVELTSVNTGNYAASIESVIGYSTVYTKMQGIYTSIQRIWCYHLRCTIVY